MSDSVPNKPSERRNWLRSCELSNMIALDFYFEVRFRHVRPSTSRSPLQSLIMPQRTIFLRAEFTLGD